MDTHNNKDRQVISGWTAEQLVNLLTSREAEFAVKALNYLDGKQLVEMEQLLSDPNRGRKEWRARGYIPRFRNITKMIVEKSGMLFKDAPPLFEVRNKGSKAVNAGATERLMSSLADTEWQEMMVNLDVVVRLLKTALLLIQWDGERFVFDILHRGNANVVINPVSKEIDVLVQRVGVSGDVEYVRVWTPDEVLTIAAHANGTASVTDREPNTYGSVPAAVFYDTAAPRAGFWVDAPHDLVNVNEMYNLHLTDSEFAISWMKRPSLFTNCSLDGYSDERLETVEVAGSPLPRAVSRPASVTAGPDVAVVVGGTASGETPFIDYKAPNIDIKPMDDVVQGWVRQAAADWSVRVRADGEGSATSGFQVVVEEAPNLELRQLRQRMFEAGFKRLYRAIRAAAPAIAPADADLFAVFSKPALPVDAKAQEDVWSVRINEGRATVIDYLMEVQGLSKQEALAKWVEIEEFNAAKSKLNDIQQGSQQQDEPPVEDTTPPEDEQQ